MHNYIIYDACKRTLTADWQTRVFSKSCIFRLRGIIIMPAATYIHFLCSAIASHAFNIFKTECMRQFEPCFYTTAYPRGHNHTPNACTIMLRSRNYVVSMPNYGASWCSTACIWVPMLDVVANYSQIVLVFVATTVWQWVPCRVIAWHRPAMCSWQMRKLFVTHACQMARHGANYA